MRGKKVLGGGCFSSAHFVKCAEEGELGAQGGVSISAEMEVNATFNIDPKRPSHGHTLPSTVAAVSG